MARKKQPKRENTPKMQGFIAGAGEIQAQDINDTLRQNYMPYAMSVIMSRAIPEIDGFKPSHRKLLYTMYKMNLLGSARTKSANIVGQTMKLNPHGDSAIYDTMVRLSRGYEALLHPYVDSKGNFGKFYSRDMAWAASRYTEARLDPICRELFRDIDKDTVDFVDNYDSTMKEPTLLPAAFLCAGAGVKIAAGWLLIPRLGVGGAEAATAACFALTAFLDLRYIVKLSGVQLSIKDIVLPVVSSLAAYVASGLLMNVGVHVLITIACFVFVYLIVYKLISGRGLKDMLKQS